MEKSIKTRLIIVGKYFGRLINAILLAIFFFASPANAQEKCFSLTQCVGNSDELNQAELVPSTTLAKCEDYKAKSKATPGLIMAERKSLVAAATCEGALDVFAHQLTASNLEHGEERQARIDAESRVLFVGIIVAIGAALSTLAAVFIVNAFVD